MRYFLFNAYNALLIDWLTYFKTYFAAMFRRPFPRRRP